jgi:hypothetical protein
MWTTLDSEDGVDGEQKLVHGDSDPQLVGLSAAKTASCVPWGDAQQHGCEVSDTST